jgi:DNA polymerase III delta prime subunit
MPTNDSVPWVEKYRPKNLNSIVLTQANKTIINSIITLNYFPNLLLYGPPGTGKTTTIINLINNYHKMNGCDGKALLIHLNASDDRGIEVIRNQISMFVKSYPLLNKGMKFVVFDEVDYMTKNAQQALRYLINEYSSTVRFCLICNYISKIDDALQSELLRLKFNNLPTPLIITFLKDIIKQENIQIKDIQIEYIQQLFQSDIRSMINYLQTNIDILGKYEIINDLTWKKIYKSIQQYTNMKDVYALLKEISITRNIDMKYIIKEFLKYIIYNATEIINNELLCNLEYNIHCNHENEYTYTMYTLLTLKKYIN